MSAMDDKTSRALVQKMFQLEAAYRDGRESAPDPRDKEITKLKYQVSRLEERLNVCKTEEENAKRGLKHAQDGRVVVDKKRKLKPPQHKEPREALDGRVKLGVGKHEMDDLQCMFPCFSIGKRASRTTQYRAPNAC
ncbi:hypothetical protein MAR_033004 [Mya arenaria]|uniref:Uncharacterized protein n=1 Tax=Mya arenaria TaxID=6604 RepID=A0ABY7GAV8_MYAAR|nr:hypothetical protein MAR_033004 [Mya arenaria]